MDVLLGLQWGDEGKGKIVDYLAPKYDLITRFQGGPNAGHTLVFNGKKFVLHQIPSGVFHPKIKNVIGNGVVLDPITLMRETEMLAMSGVPVVSRLYISKKAHIIIPTHRLLDAAYEQHKGDHKIGSTLKGVGPVYSDKIGRQGLRIGDMLQADFKIRYQSLKEKHLRILGGYQHPLHELAELEKTFMKAVDYMKNLQIVDSEYLLFREIKQEKNILAEGAQGSLLDVDFGSYPFVTSSNTFSAAASVGLGIPPQQIKETFGIFKAYCTRVGSGPFPTELHNEIGKKLQDAGSEYGATTGRPRRCGWLDLPALKYAVMINGITQLFMMKADVLNHFKTLRICTKYRLLNGTLTDQLPYELTDENIQPVYRDFEGWNCTLNQVKTFENFPTQLLCYINFIEEQTGVPITILSTGPDREQTIFKSS